MSLTVLLETGRDILTPTQITNIEAVIEHNGNKQAAAQALGISRSTIRSSVRGAEKRVSKLGYHPDSGLNNPAAPGFGMKGYSHIRRDEDGKMIGWDKYVVDSATIEIMMKLAMEEMLKDIPKTKPLKLVTPKSDPDLLNLYVVTDYHLGMLAWAEETGADWDIDIAEELLVKWFQVGIARSPNAETAIFAQLGDFLHFDSLEAVTPSSGHLLDADTRFQKLVRVAIRVIRRVLTMLLEKYPKVIVLMCEGNHDMASSVWLREWLAAFYDDEPRIVVDQSVDPYYVYEHGYTSLFFHHGHKRKVANIDSVFVSKYREIFGRTKHSYAHMGHLHHVEVKETNLMIVEQHRTLAAPDAYAARGGYGSGRDSSVISYHKQYGLDSRIIVTPEAAMAAEF